MTGLNRAVPGDTIGPSLATIETEETDETTCRSPGRRGVARPGGGPRHALELRARRRRRRRTGPRDRALPRHPALPGTSGYDGSLPLREYRAAVLTQQDRLLDEVVGSEPVYRWTTALNGFAVHLTRSRPAGSRRSRRCGSSSPTPSGRSPAAPARLPRPARPPIRPAQVAAGPSSASWTPACTRRARSSPPLRAGGPPARLPGDLRAGRHLGPLRLQREDHRRPPLRGRVRGGAPRSGAALAARRRRARHPVASLAAGNAGVNALDGDQDHGTFRGPRPRPGSRSTRPAGPRPTPTTTAARVPTWSPPSTRRWPTGSTSSTSPWPAPHPRHRRPGAARRRRAGRVRLGRRGQRRARRAGHAQPWVTTVGGTTGPGRPAP